MTKTLRLLAVAAALAVALPAHAEPTLRPAVTVAGPIITLGDLFAEAGPHAGDAVANAPLPGMRVTVSGDWLAAIARAHDLDWTPDSDVDRATIERPGRTVEADTVAQQLLAAIGQRQSVADADLRLDNPALHFTVPANASDTLTIEGLVVDRHSGRFSAVVVAATGDPAAVRQRVAGRVVYRVSIPVLDRPIEPGAIIAAADITEAKIERDHLAADAVTDGAELIGKTPRRPLRADEPLQLGDVAPPILVHKGELVTIALETPSLSLTAQGKALEDGALGALVRIENTKSSRVIDATVTGYGMAAVAAPSLATAAAARLAAR